MYRTWEQREAEADREALIRTLAIAQRERARLDLVVEYLRDKIACASPVLGPSVVLLPYSDEPPVRPVTVS